MERPNKVILTLLSNHAGGFYLYSCMLRSTLNKPLVEVTVIKLFAYNQLIKDGTYDVTVPRETLPYWRAVIHVTVKLCFKSVF